MSVTYVQRVSHVANTWQPIFTQQQLTGVMLNKFHNDCVCWGVRVIDVIKLMSK